MSQTERKQLAHELAIEYVKANPSILQDVPDNIPKIAEKFFDIEDRFYNAVTEISPSKNLY